MKISTKAGGGGGGLTSPNNNTRHVYRLKRSTRVKLRIYTWLDSKRVVRQPLGNISFPTIGMLPIAITVACFALHVARNHIDNTSVADARYLHSNRRSDLEYTQFYRRQNAVYKVEKLSQDRQKF